MKLYAISDLHISHPENMRALSEIGRYPDDWLLLGGDIGETVEELEACLKVLTERFARLFWVPGNHELWTTTEAPGAARGEAKYHELVEVCRKYQVLTPEDDYIKWPGNGPACTIAPVFLLYDYSFRGDAVPRDLDAAAAVQYSQSKRVLCTDEALLHPDPYPDRAAWCRARVELTEKRLAAVEGPLVLLNHFPLREEDADLPRVPTFVLWCGTRLTEDWPERFPIHTVVYGHLHIRRDKRNAVGQRFVDVSVGYPRQRAAGRSIDSFLVEILPGSAD
ncbi:MAG: metallophosphoesterase [bacterium]|nr:metallophosphoesterase [bacterium]